MFDQKTQLWIYCAGALFVGLVFGFLIARLKYLFSPLIDVRLIDYEQPPPRIPPAPPTISPPPRHPLTPDNYLHYNPSIYRPSVPQVNYVTLRQEVNPCWIQVHFFPDEKLPCNNIREGAKCNKRRCEYAHDKTSLIAIMKWLHGAKKTLDVCVFCFTNKNLAEQLVQLKRRGIKVRVITNINADKPFENKVEYLKENGIELRCHIEGGPAKMHNKFVVRDKSQVLVGSFNWTRTAILENDESVIIFNDSKCATKFNSKFEELWKSPDYAR